MSWAQLLKSIRESHLCPSTVVPLTALNCIAMGIFTSDCDVSVIAEADVRLYIAGIRHLCVIFILSLALPLSRHDDSLHVVFSLVSGITPDLQVDRRGSTVERYIRLPV